MLDSSLNLDFHALFGDMGLIMMSLSPKNEYTTKTLSRKETQTFYEAKVDYEDPVWKGKPFRNYDQNIMMYTKYKVTIFSKSILNHIFPAQTLLCLHLILASNP